MSEFMMKLFRLKKKNDVPSAEEAVKRLRDLEEMLMKKTDFLEKKIEEQLIIAKKNGTTNKRVALKALRAKKKFEKELNQVDSTLSTLEYQREALENASVTSEVVNVMRITSKALEQVHADLNLDKIEDLMDKITEQQELSKEIFETLSRPLGSDEYDDDELLEELEELQQDDLNDELTTIKLDQPITDRLPLDHSITDRLPSVPQNDPLSASLSSTVSTKEDEDELKELAAWAN